MRKETSKQEKGIKCGFYLFSIFPLPDIMGLRHQSSAMCIIMLGEKTHTRGLQRE